MIAITATGRITTIRALHRNGERHKWQFTLEVPTKLAPLRIQCIMFDSQERCSQIVVDDWVLIQGKMEASLPPTTAPFVFIVHDIDRLEVPTEVSQQEV